MSNNASEALIPFRKQLAEAFAEALRSTVAAQKGGNWQAETHFDLPSLADLDSAQPISTLSLTGRLAGQATLTLDANASAALLAPLAGAAAQDPSTAWADLVSSAQGALRQTLGFSGGPIDVNVGREVTTGQAMTRIAAIELTGPADGAASLLLAIDSVLEDSLAKAASGTALQPGLQGLAVSPKAQLDRVIDVPLAVTLRFGQRHLTLREVLALSTGSLVELDRQVEEPVELVLGERLVARGEVVIVDGNYGLRVTEVMEGAAHRIQKMHSAGGQTMLSSTESAEL